RLPAGISGHRNGIPGTDGRPTADSGLAETSRLRIWQSPTAMAVDTAARCSITHAGVLGDYGDGRPAYRCGINTVGGGGKSRQADDADPGLPGEKAIPAGEVCCPF